MDRYNAVTQAASKAMTVGFSSSFGLSSRLLPPKKRQAIYNIYGLVRLADEIVDSSHNDDALGLLNALEAETYTALKSGYSTNLIVHAFVLTARDVGIDSSLVQPFFASMRTDALGKKTFTQLEYRNYIYGSAEVIGLLCLKVFCAGDAARYEQLTPGAQALGAAFQKVNFLRDLAYDVKELGRLYFPGVKLERFTDTVRDAIVAEIEHDFHVAEPTIKRLPRDVRPAVATAYRYYRLLLDKLAATPATEIAQKRIRISDLQKLLIMTRTYSKEKLGRAA